MTISQTTTSLAAQSRRYDLDWLRVAAVLLLIPFHGALTFNLDPNSVVYIKDTVESPILIIMGWLIHQFHMPLLFAIAGASTYFALQKRMAGQYLVERINRLFVPALFSIIFLIPPMTYLSRLWQGDSLTFWQHLTRFFVFNPEELTGISGNFTPGHVWFILFLFLFSIIGLPLFLLEKKTQNGKLAKGLAGFFEKPFTLYLLLIPLSLAASIDLLGDKNPIYYFGTFLLGYLLMTDERYQKAIDREAFISLSIGIACFIVRILWVKEYDVWSGGWLIKGLIEQAVRIFLLFGILGLRHRLITKGGKVLDYLSKAAFPFYLLHFVVLTSVTFFVVQIQASIAVKCFIMISVSTLLTFGFYEILRRLKVFRFLLGIK